jgi:hypothetical protein
MTITRRTFLGSSVASLTYGITNLRSLRRHQHPCSRGSKWPQFTGRRSARSKYRRRAVQAVNSFFWGDVVHIGPLRFARPDWMIAFDVDQPKAAAAERLLIAGMHLPFPGFGYVDRAVEGFACVPAPWEPVL